MRRLVFSIVLGVGLVMVGGTGASAADPTPTATVSAKATAGKKICQVKDPLLDELSGLVATKTGFIAINDSTTDSRKKVFFLDSKCTIKSKKNFSGAGPKDTEDMVLSPDGKNVWIADTGDNEVLEGTGETRPTVAVWTMPVSGKTEPVIHRLSYPDGDKHDAEALLLDGDGLPIIVTKELGTAVLYKPAAALKNNNDAGVPLKKVGELALPATETKSNAFAKVFNKVITGGSVAPGGDRVVLRTYTDAVEFDVKNGDVLAALKGEPRTTGLPDETFGEAISYSADGKTFFTVSDMNGDHDTANYIRQYVPATEVAVVSKNQSGAGAAGDKWYSNLSVSDITKMVGGVGVIGLVLVAIGVIGIVRFRKANPAGPTVDEEPSGSIKKADPETELIGVGSGPKRGAAYGGGGNGPVYGAKSGGPSGGGPSGGQQKPGVYGGSRPAGPAGAGAPGNSGGHPRGPQQPPRGPQQRPAAQPPRPQQQPRPPQQPQQRGGQQPPRGPQPPRSPQPPQRGGQQPGRDGSGGGAGVYGGGNGQQRPQGGGQQRPQGGQQRPQGGVQRPQANGQQRPQGNGQRPQGSGQQRPQGNGQRPPGGGQPRQPGTYGGGRPPQGRDDNGYDRR
ncbi:proline-rich domain-containing protein [Actinoplanes siamensis]|nr:proline-rich domain-containing protein [Actinoplanes siamensis]